MKDKQEQHGFKKDLHECLEQMKAKREINRKRDEEAAEEAYWNAPLDQKDRD